MISLSNIFIGGENMNTQLNAWDAIQPTIHKKRNTVLNAIKEINGGTLNDIAHYLDWPINRVSGRVTELHRKGKIINDGTKINPESGKPNKIWRAKDAI